MPIRMVQAVKVPWYLERDLIFFSAWASQTFPGQFGHEVSVALSRCIASAYPHLARSAGVVVVAP